MRTLSIIAALTLGAAMAMPAKANLNPAAQPEASSRVVALPGGVVAMPRGRAAMVEHPAGRYAEMRSRFGYFAFGRHYPIHRRNQGQRAERAPARLEPRPAPARAAAPADPRGPLWLSSARGAALAERPYNVGEALPPGLPHVTIDWRQFDLPAPPRGQFYARVGRDVLLITAAGRIVESVLPPG